MAITLDGGEGLFDRVGAIGAYLAAANEFQDATASAAIEAVMAEYDTLRDYAAAVPALLPQARANATAVLPVLQQVAQSTLIKMVFDDAPARAGSLQSAVEELVRQMSAGTESVAACTVACTSTAIAGSNGSGVVVLSTKRGDGLVQENAVAEVGPLTCTSDSQTGGTALGSETFTYAGQADANDRYSYDWPTGSGATASLTAVNAELDATGGNLLTNSDFETFTANLPNGWVAVVGTPGTDLKPSLVTYLSGTKSLELVGGGAAVSLTQVFNSSSGTAGTLSPVRGYAVNFWVKADVVPAAGVLTVDLIDQNGTVVNDAQGVPNSFAVTLSAVTTSFAAYSGAFRLPKALPTTVRLRLRLSTGLSSGSSIFIDRLAMAPFTSFYAGGPGAVVFSGATKFVAGDGWNVTTSNDRASADYCATFQALADRFFNMRSMGLLLPSSGSPTIDDALIG